MVQNPPKDMPRIVPYLHYNKVEEALEWLSAAFGFKVSFTMPDSQGHLLHAEMRYGDGLVMMGPTSRDYGALSPLDLAGVNQGLYIYVDDVIAHFEHAKANGADIIMEPEYMFWGDRMYTAKDLEGHKWTFSQHVKDVPPEEMRLPESWDRK